MHAIRSGKETLIPRYNFTTTTSSHDLQGHLRSGYEPLLIKPGDVIFLEGNYPFHQPDVAPLVGIKIVYLSSDEIRLKRKWRRDIDYRKKYDPVYFVNRYFRTQFIRAEEVYRPLMQACNIVVDTSDAAIWLTADMQALITDNECSIHRR
jgi:uridine kinase